MAALWADDGVARLLLRKHKLTEVPGIERCQKLEVLDIADNGVATLPSGLAALPVLRSLTAFNNPLTSIDDGLASSLRLQSVDFSHTALKTLPPGVAKWPVQAVRLVGMPPDFAWTDVLQRLDPSQLWTLTLGENPALAGVVGGIGRFRALRLLHLNACAIRDVPPSFGELVHLETLSLFTNELESLPELVASLPALRSLVVSKNPGTRRIRAELKKRGVSYAVT